MKLQDHVIYSIEAFGRGEKEHSLMHACIAIDSTASKIFSKTLSSNKDYKNCIRQHYWLIQYFLGGGIDFNVTKFSHVTLENGFGKTINNPDLADIIYHIFRCNSAHSKEIPLHFQLTTTEGDQSRWLIGTGNTLQMPERIIWALLAVSVFSKANASLTSEGDYYLTWGSESTGIQTITFVIKDHWGKEDEVRSILSQHKQIYIDIKGLDEFKK